MKNEDKIANWSRTAGLRVSDGFNLNFNYADKAMAHKLIEEELLEFKDAVKNEDGREIQDSLGDMLWTVIRAFQTYGVNIDKTIDAIYTSNMSKFCKTKAEAERTVTAYANGEHPDKKGVFVKTYYVKVNDLYVIRRESDRKIMKSILFSEPIF